MSVYTKRLETLRAERLTYGAGKGAALPDSFKKKVLKHHYDSGMNLTTLAGKVGIHFTTLHKWKRVMGTGQTHAKHGETTRADLKTKALAVTDELDNGMSTIAIANKYNITRQQYGAWKAATQGRYQEFREFPDGVIFVTKPEKLIVGDANIRAYRDLMKAQLEIRLKLLAKMHSLGYGHVELEAEVALMKTAVLTAEALKDIK